MTKELEKSNDKLIVKLDSQILDGMSSCGELYRLAYVENWRPNKRPPALERGGTMHKMLDFYYSQRKEGRGKLEDHAALVQETLVVGRLAMAKTDIDNDDFEDDETVFKNYILRWQYDGWEILEVEQPFSFVLHEDDKPIVVGGVRYLGLIIIYEGIVDLRVVDPKLGQIVVDTKTESRKFNPFILNNQFQGYEMAFNVPVVVNKVGYQKSLPDNERFRRIIHQSGPLLLEEWKQDVVYTVRTAIGWHNDDYFPRNRTSCFKGFSACFYQMVCKEAEAGDGVREHKLTAYFHKEKPWDPYTRDSPVEELVNDI